MAKHPEQTLPEFDFDLSRRGRGTYNKDEFVFKRWDESYKDSTGQLRLKSRKGGDKVTAKLFLDIDRNGRFSRDELIFKGSAEDEGIYERLKESSGKIRWDYDDCTPCLRMPLNSLTLNPIGSQKVGFFTIEPMGEFIDTAIVNQI